MNQVEIYGFVAFACWGVDGDVQPDERGKGGLRNYKDLHTPWELARGTDRLISGRVGTPDGVPKGRISKSASDGSGVDIREEAMYLVSAISRWSRISSRSSMRKARCSVSL